MYAERKGWLLEALDVSLALTGAEEKRIERTLAIKGLSPKEMARLAEIAERMPVTLTLKSGIAINAHVA